MSTPRLPVLTIALEAYRLLFRNFGTYLRLSWLPFLILFAVTVGMRFYYRDVTGLFGDGDIVLGITSTIVLEVLGGLFEAGSWLVTIPVATAWTRMVLLNSGQRVSFAVGRAEAVYLLRSLCLLLLMLLAVALIVGPLWLIMELMEFDFDVAYQAASEGLVYAATAAVLLLVVLLSYLSVTRLALALPAAAVGDPSRLRDSYSMTKGRIWALFAVLLLTVAPNLLYATASLAWADSLEFGADDGVAQALLIAADYHAISWLFFPVSAGALALAYRHLGGMAAPSSEPAADSA